MQTRHGHSRLCDGVIRISLDDLFFELLVVISFERPLRRGYLVASRTGYGTHLIVDAFIEGHTK